MNTGSLFGMRLRTGPDTLDEIRWRLGKRLSTTELSEDGRTLVLLAVEEAAGNVLEHAYGGDDGFPVSVWMRDLAEDRFEISIWDRAPKWSVCSPRKSLQELARSRSTRGRGCALLQILAEEVNHTPREAGGNILSLVFDPAQLERRVEEHLREAA